MEYWSIGLSQFPEQHSITPTLHHSNPQGADHVLDANR